MIIRLECRIVCRVVTLVERRVPERKEAESCAAVSGRRLSWPHSSRQRSQKLIGTLAIYETAQLFTCLLYSTDV